MRITADTNLLVRIAVKDDLEQARVAFELLSSADLVVIPLPCLCEVVWVLDSIYNFSNAELEMAIRAIVEPRNAVVDTAVVEAGLTMLSLGGDFADAVIAAAGNIMGGEMFVSFDRKAVSRLSAMGFSAGTPRDLA
jgi:predicted nucleic-acid-binding protein